MTRFFFLILFYQGTGVGTGSNIPGPSSFQSGQQRHLVATVAQYIYHRHSYRLPSLATLLLKRLATVYWRGRAAVFSVFVSAHVYIYHTSVDRMFLLNPLADERVTQLASADTGLIHDAYGRRELSLLTSVGSDDMVFNHNAKVGGLVCPGKSRFRWLAVHNFQGSHISMSEEIRLEGGLELGETKGKTGAGCKHGQENISFSFRVETQENVHIRKSLLRGSCVLLQESHYEKGRGILSERDHVELDASVSAMQNLKKEGVSVLFGKLILEETGEMQGAEMEPASVTRGRVSSIKYGFCEALAFSLSNCHSVLVLFCEAYANLFCTQFHTLSVVQSSNQKKTHHHHFQSIHIWLMVASFFMCAWALAFLVTSQVTVALVNHILAVIYVLVVSPVLIVYWALRTLSHLSNLAVFFYWANSRPLVLQIQAFCSFLAPETFSLATIHLSSWSMFYTVICLKDLNEKNASVWACRHVLYKQKRTIFLFLPKSLDIIPQALIHVNRVVTTRSGLLSVLKKVDSTPPMVVASVRDRNHKNEEEHSSSCSTCSSVSLTLSPEAEPPPVIPLPPPIPVPLPPEGGALPPYPPPRPSSSFSTTYTVMLRVGAVFVLMLVLLFLILKLVFDEL